MIPSQHNSDSKRMRDEEESNDRSSNGNSALSGEEIEDFCSLFMDAGMKDETNNSDDINYSTIPAKTYMEKIKQQEDFVREIEKSLFEFPTVDSSSDSEDDEEMSDDISVSSSSASDNDDSSTTEDTDEEQNNEPYTLSSGSDLLTQSKPVAKPSSSKLNIINLSSLQFAPFTHPDLCEIANIMHFHKSVKNFWNLSENSTSHHFVHLTDFLESHYNFKNTSKKSMKQKKKCLRQLPCFVMFQIVFGILNCIIDYNDKCKMKVIPDQDQDQHLFDLYRLRQIFDVNIIETLFLRNVKVSPRFREANEQSATFHKDDIGLSQFVDIDLDSQFYTTIEQYGLSQSDVMFCLGIFMIQLLLMRRGDFVTKIITNPFNEPLICDMILQNNRHDIYLIRLILSLTRINEYYTEKREDVVLDNETVNENFIARVTLQNLIGIEVVHIVSCIAEDRKELFEKFTLPYLIKLYDEPNYAPLFNNRPSKYLAKVQGTEKDLVCAFLSGIALYGMKKLDESVFYYLRESVMHPSLEEDKFAIEILRDLKKAQNESSFTVLAHADLYLDISNMVQKIHGNNIQQDIKAVFHERLLSPTSTGDLPYFVHVAFSFLGKALAEAKKLDSALYYTELSLLVATEQYTPNTTALFTKAYVFDKLEKYTESGELYQSVIKNYKGYSMAHNNLGICLKRLNQHKQAIEEYENSLRIDPSNHLTYNNRALYYNDHHESENAILYYKMAIRLKPTYHLPLSNLAYTYSQMSKFDQSIDMFSRALFLGPNNITALANRGYCYMRKNMFEKATEDYLKLVVELKSEERNILYNLSLCMYQTKRYKEAIFYATRILRKNPKDEWVLYNRSLFYEKAQLYMYALDDIENFLTLMPNSTAGQSLCQRLKVICNKITRVC